ncbi:MBOAT family O-acyltransferase [Bacillus marinisedimentorum]|uniref:MBOAT family O-acyltransferase n=1 Tax=Bacillus marinisedimentorum TaxID=1821260 RepID=UPI0007E14DFC|nr:MBOAT family O-acyltransferase [Bacillus marinisedimentorum]
MLFNSFGFIFLFLPLTLIVYYTLTRFRAFHLAKLTLIVASLFFYGYWNPKYLLLIGFSIVFNYAFSKWLGKKPSKWSLGFGVAVNLALLGYYKYADFFLENVNAVFGMNMPLLQIVLPLAISFFTFQQIGFLVDSYHGDTKDYNFFNYTLFVVFFPQLIAGPIVHHTDVIPQFQKEKTFQLNHRNVSLGVLIFSLGLFKKVVIADSLALWATPAFDQASSLTMLEAWGAALAYTFQLYFDFSGYSEMALGLGLFFNIKLPVNFMSPYKANSISEFWRSWHMTLSRFLRDYLYIALGGNRKGKTRKYINLFLTMFLGGIWHGAGWTFVIWGAMHGMYNVINHVYRELKKKLFRLPAKKAETAAAREEAPETLWTTIRQGMAVLPYRLITFLSVVVAWVFFRALTVEDAFKVLKGMAGMNGIEYGKLDYLPGGTTELLILGALFIFVSVAPNTIEVAEKMKPTAKWAVFIAVVLVTALLFINREAEFLYFQF